MQFLAAFIMKGRMQAMTVASSLALFSLLFPPISIVSSASLALVTLRRGAGEGMYVLVCSCLAAGILSLLLLGNYQYSLMYGLAFWLPVWLISIVLREGRHLVVAIEIAVLLGVAAVFSIYSFQEHPAQFWRQVLEFMIQPMLSGQSDAAVEQIHQSADTLAHYMTGVAAAGSVCGLLLGLFLARWWQAALFNPGGFRSEFLALRAHMPFTLVTLALMAVAWLSPEGIAEFCWNVLLVAFVLYVFVGTAVLHAAFANSKGGRFMVPFLYITLMLVPHVTAVVVLCGLSDTWLDLRNKFKPNGA
ncbi:DUF2232 domain-containing protein [Methylomonas koyamae]|uniref:DUF2232 domain-containing protein n=1 Tax=Methylomonas koyamae TaxID=702114 RepID=UPI0006D1F300|nr:DUF2232 domain-containing protein [Methylomonas koyamae]BBL58110.1 hypothetical protein MKFW12EY_17230 [Methylomonas koyamae]